MSFVGYDVAGRLITHEERQAALAASAEAGQWDGNIAPSEEEAGAEGGEENAKSDDNDALTVTTLLLAERTAELSVAASQVTELRRELILRETDLKAAEAAKVTLKADHLELQGMYQESVNALGGLQDEKASLQSEIESLKAEIVDLKAAAEKPAAEPQAPAAIEPVADLTAAAPSKNKK